MAPEVMFRPELIGSEQKGTDLCVFSFCVCVCMYVCMYVWQFNNRGTFGLSVFWSIFHSQAFMTAW